MQNLQMPWFAAAQAQANPLWFSKQLLDFGIYQQHALAEKIKSQSTVGPVRAKKGFSIDAILADDDKDREMKTVASHPYFPAIQLPMPSPQQLQDLHSMSRSHRNKRIRTIFTHEQLEALEQEFTRQQYMVGSERYYLANKLHLSEAQVKVWFQNRRIKYRKQNLEGGKVSDLHDFYNATSSTASSDTCSESGSDTGSI